MRISIRSISLMLAVLAAAGLAVSIAAGTSQAAGLRVGAAAVDIEADDTMPIAGGIHAGYARGQEGKLRAVAVVMELAGAPPVAIVSCDVLVLTRDLVDPVAAQIEKDCGVPAGNLMVHTTHTHHAPSTIVVHGYGRDDVFCRRVQQAIVRAVGEARRAPSESVFSFKLGREETVGMNSRLLLSDGTIYWTGTRDDVVRPTGPFDPDLPVLAFRSPAGAMQALLYGHSTHTIGALKPGVRSPAFYGLVAQKLEKEMGGVAGFLEGASGSTHNLKLTAAESMAKIEQAVRDALAAAKPQAVDKLGSLKRPFTFRVRTFDEAAEDKAVSDYCRKRIGQHADPVIAVFRDMRKKLAPVRGQERSTWLQVVRVGPVALVGVPAELFTKLGIQIKRRSPFQAGNTVVVELTNDWIGYVGDREGYKLGGYQMWMGLHSYCEPGTGERMVDQAAAMLEEMAK
jgi:hypothetical protein